MLIPKSVKVAEIKVIVSASEYIPKSSGVNVLAMSIVKISAPLLLVTLDKNSSKMFVIVLFFKFCIM